MRRRGKKKEAGRGSERQENRNRQTDIQRFRVRRETDKQTKRETETERWTDGHTDRSTQTHQQMNKGQTERKTETDRQTDGQTDRQTERQTDRPASLMVGRVGREANPQEVLHTLQATSLNGCEECTLTLGGSGSHVSCLRIQEVIAMDLTWLSSSVAMEPPVCSNRNWQFSVNPWRAAMCRPVEIHVSMRPTLIVHCICKIHVHTCTFSL